MKFMSKLNSMNLIRQYFKISNKNNVKLKYCYIPIVANLINNK